jgi:hypothetical protein
MLVRTRFPFVMGKLFFGNDKVLLDVKVEDELMFKGLPR